MRRFIALALVTSLLGCAPEPPNESQRLLMRRDFASLEKKLALLQESFSSGALTDLQLRSEYRAFDRMPEQMEKLLDEWVRAYPNSYYARAARGYHHRSHALWSRGTGLANDMSSQQWRRVTQRLELAELDMKASLKLNPQPLISVYVLMDTAGLPCNRKALDDYFALRDSFAPTSTLLFNRQLHYLKPRWCGSREAMNQLVSTARGARMSEDGLQQMQAILDDDVGHSLMLNERESEAIPFLQRAAAVAIKAGPQFRRESLFGVNEYACSVEALKQYCQ